MLKEAKENRTRIMALDLGKEKVIRIESGDNAKKGGRKTGQVKATVRRTRRSSRRDGRATKAEKRNLQTRKIVVGGGSVCAM